MSQDLGIPTWHPGQKSFTPEEQAKEKEQEERQEEEKEKEKEEEKKKKNQNLLIVDEISRVRYRLLEVRLQNYKTIG